MTRFAAIGLDHRHIYDLVGGLLEAGATCVGACPESSDPRVLEGFTKRFPHVPALSRAALLDDPSIDVICCAAVPRDRAGIAMRAMQAGKDVMLDKPGATTLGQLAALESAVAETGRIVSICFTERFLVPGVELAGRIAAEGAIGQVVATLGLGPHRLNRAIRPAWFFDMEAIGGILTDIASHQIDQFIYLTGASDARIAAARVANLGTPDLPGFEDFGEIALEAEGARGSVRVDWFTPDGLPAWGDGRLFVTGTQGTIELRKYLDIEGRPGPGHLFLADRNGTRHLDTGGEPLTYFRRFLADVRERSETAMPQAHAFTVTRLAIEAQMLARSEMPNTAERQPKT